MDREKMLETLKLLSNPLNLEILVLLGTKSSYPRELARILGRDETLVSRRLRLLERAGLVRGRWARLGSGRNVRIYELAVPELKLSFKPGREGETRPLRDMLARGIRLHVPEAGPMVGRDEEKRRLLGSQSRVVVIWGLPGVGKTTLASWLAGNSERPVYWHTCSEMDDPEYIVWRLSLFLAGLGAEDPLNYLAMARANTLVALDLVARDADRLGVDMIFDDYHVVEKRPAGTIIRRLAEELREARLILVSRTRPGRLRVPGGILEIKLGTLGVKEAAALLAMHGVGLSGEKLAEVYAATAGHPLALKLYAASAAGGENPLRAARGRIVEYMWRELLHRLSEKHRLIISRLAPFAEPQPLDLIGSITGIRDPEPLLLELVDYGVAEKYGDRYRLHGLLRLLVDRRYWADTYLAAARYYYSQGGWHGLFHAMKYYLEAGAYDKAAEVIRERMWRDEYGYTGYLESYEEILERILEARLPQGLRAYVLHDKALIHLLRGRLEEAYEALQLALRLSEDAFIRASVLERMGFVLSDLGRHEEAEERLLEALATVEEEGLDNPMLLYGIYADLVKTAAEAGDLEKAEKYLEEELRAAEPIDDYFYKLAGLIHLANIRLMEGRAGEAASILEDVAGDLETYGNRMLQALSLLVLSEAYLELGRIGEAIETSERGLRLYSAIRHDLRRAEFLLVRSKALLRAGKAAEALRDVVETLELICREKRVMVLREASRIIEEVCSRGLSAEQARLLRGVLERCIEALGMAGPLQDSLTCLDAGFD